MSNRLAKPAAAFGFTEWFRQGEHERVLAASLLRFAPEGG